MVRRGTWAANLTLRSQLGREGREWPQSLAFAAAKEKAPQCACADQTPRAQCDKAKAKPKANSICQGARVSQPSRASSGWRQSSRFPLAGGGQAEGAQSGRAGVGH